MARYEWPADVAPDDNPLQRGAYTARYPPSPNVQTSAAPQPPPFAPPVGGPAPAPGAAPGPGPGLVPHAAPSTGVGLWLPLGPSTLVGGQAGGRPNVSGRVRDLAVEPTTGDRVYAATASGGVWYSGDRGVSWKPLDEFVESPGKDTLFPIGNVAACGAIHVNWGTEADGSLDEVIVGTGEPSQPGRGEFTPGSPGGTLVGIGFLTAIGPAVDPPVGQRWSTPTATDPMRGQVVWRIARDPVDDTLGRQQLYAATSLGLLAREPGVASWTAPATVPPRTIVPPPTAGHGNPSVIDVVVQRSSTDRLRVWFAMPGEVWVAEVTSAPKPPSAISLAAPAATYRQIPIPGIGTDSRIVLAARGDSEVWVLGTSPHDRNDAPKARLVRIDTTVALATLTGVAISGMPEGVFMSAGDQSWYDMALALHPDKTDTLFVGGATMEIDGEYSATAYRLVVADAKATATNIGAGVHADLHVIRIGPKRDTAPLDRHVWIGCDGGVFFSDADGRSGTFVNRNNGLATLQPGFVACHPTNDGLVAAGVQDNGTIDRVGDTVWRESFEGDGGGVVYHPAPTATGLARYWRQYNAASWEPSDGTGTKPVLRTIQAHTGTESDASLFYSGASALAHRGAVHLAICSNRPWYSSDWGENWVTVPTGTDPRSSLFPDLVQDVLVPVGAPSTACCTPTFDHGSGVITCRLSKIADGDDRVRLYVLWGAGLAVFEGTPGAGGAMTWKRDVVEQIRQPASATPPSTEFNDVAAGNPVRFLPAVHMVNDVVVHDPARGAHGSCYVATTGGTGGGLIDTVWWYDGAGNFQPCGVRRNQPGRGDWPPTQVRITSPALALAVDPTDASIVYVGTSVGVIKGVVTFDGAGVPKWKWERFDNGLPEGAVHDLSIFSDGTVKLLRAAIQARGVWEVDLAAVATTRTYLRVYPSDARRRRPTPLDGPATFGEPALRWDSSPDIVIDQTTLVWPATGPGEGDLYDGRFSPTVGQHASQALRVRTFKAHVLVHHRWLTAATPLQVKVALVRHAFPADGGDVALDTLWDVMRSLAGGVSRPLPDGWFAAATELTRPILADVEPRLPRAVSFDVDLSALATGDRQVLVAVVMSGDDQIGLDDEVKPDGTGTATLRDLVLNSRHVAARSIQLV
ncbi:MAG: hypothetical protein ABIR68_05845 [Ilumatobacteraceae bacterium]